MNEHDGLAQLDGLEDDVRTAYLAARRIHTMRVWLVRVFAFSGFLATWDLVGRFELVDPLFISNPLDVVQYMADVAWSGEIWPDMLATLSAAAVGLVIGATAGIGLAVLFHSVPALGQGLAPFVTMANSLPRPALAPLFILWFGIGMGSKAAVAISVVLFVLLLNTMAGLLNIPEDLLALSRTLDMSRWQLFTFVQLPAALPAIIAGLRLGAVYSVLGVVVAEMLASFSGLGQVLVYNTNRFDIAGSLGILIYLALLASFLNALISLLERKVDWNK